MRKRKHKYMSRKKQQEFIKAFDEIRTRGENSKNIDEYYRVHGRTTKEQLIKKLKSYIGEK